MKNRRPQAPLPITSNVQGWTPEKEALAYNLEKQHGLPEGTLRGMSWVESNFGRLREHSNTYQGEYQLGPKVRNDVGIPAGQSRDWQESMKGGAAYAAQNMRDLQNKIGRAPTRDELYIAHQQGLGGAAGLINHPNAPAGRYAPARNIAANHGNPAAPSRDFTNKFTNQFEAGVKLGANELWNGPQAKPQMGDQQMVASLGGDKSQAPDLTTMMARAASPQPTQVASNPPLPPEAASNQRYAAMNSVAPRGGNDTSFRDMARHTAYAPNRMEAMGDVKPMSSAEYLVANSGDSGVSARDPGVSAPAPPPSSPMADTPILHEPMQAGSPGGEGMAMNALQQPEMSPMTPQGGGLGDMFAQAAMPPGVMQDPGFSLGGLGGFDFGSLFG